MAKTEQKDLFFPENAPPPYITTQHGINNSDSIISFPEVVVNNPDGGQGRDPLVKNFAFNDKMIRQGFIRKVYALIVVQLLVTCVVIAWFMNDHNLQYAIRENMGLFLGVTLGVYASTAVTIACCEGPRRRAPYNFLFLLAFTLALSALVGVSCSYMRSQEVLVAGGVTVAIFLSLTLFAFQTKIDFTMMSGSLFCLFLVFSLFGILMLATPFETIRLLYCAIGVLFMCVYIVYDTQLMIGGHHRYALSPEEYVFAALNLYVDIMYIFIKILRLLR